MTTLYLDSRFGKPERARWVFALLVTVALPSLVPACNFLDLDPLCCIDPLKVELRDPASTAQYLTAVAAAGDLTAAARRSFDEVVTACQNLAFDLDTPKEELARARDVQGHDAASAWCDLAIAGMTSRIRAQGRLVVTFTPPRCTTSVATKANCRARCAPVGPCDIKASPLRCEGGNLRVSCRGTCSAPGGAEVACEGACEGTCQGTCASPSGVPCNGTCEGTCETSPGGGIRTDGTCQGICKGTCSSVAAGATCNGTCVGSCRGACKSTGTVAAQCDGTCDGPAQALSCEGGKLEGGCAVDPKCDANCDASVTSKAECSPSEVSIQAPDGIPTKYLASLKANLPALVLVAQGRGQTFVDTLSATAGALPSSVSPAAVTTKSAKCLELLAWQTVDELGGMRAAVRASEKVLDEVRR